MNTATTTEPPLNLTEWEMLAINSELNLSDGHPRQHPTEEQWAIVRQLPDLFAQCSQEPAEAIERRAVRAFMDMVQQRAYPADRVLLCYASSVAMEIVARALSAKVDRCALVNPTFDNIPDLMRGNGIELVPVDESVYTRGMPEDVLSSVGCVFLTTPNNPTGLVIAEDVLEKIATQCREHDVVLALDTCFRSFDARAQYDHYAVLDRSGCRWVMIEDTGKTWPMHELKVGMLAYSENLDLDVAKVHSDILLAVSPVILRLVELLAKDGIDGGLERLHRMVADNRSIVHECLAGVPEISFPYQDNNISVEIVDLGDRLAHDVWEALSQQRVFLLPGNAFYWAAPEDGDHRLRVALGRDPEKVRRAVSALAEHLLLG